MTLGPQFNQLPLFDTSPYETSVPVQEPEPAPQPKPPVGDWDPEAVESAPPNFKYKGPKLYHGTSSDLGIGDIIYPTGKDVYPGAGAGTGLGKEIPATYLTPDITYAAAYATFSGGERHIASHLQPRLFHTVVEAEPLGKTHSRSTDGTVEVLSAHGARVTGIVGYLRNPMAYDDGGQPLPITSTLAHKIERLSERDDESPEQEKERRMSQLRELRQSEGITSIERKHMRNSDLMDKHSIKMDKFYDKLDANPNWRLSRKDSDSMDAMMQTFDPANARPGWSYRELHGEDPPWLKDTE